MPLTGTSAPRPPLVTPPADPRSSLALALLAATALSSSSVASSNRFRQFPRPHPVPATSSLPDAAHPSSVRTGVVSSNIPDPARSSSVQTSAVSSLSQTITHLPTWDPSPSHSWTHHPSLGRHPSWEPSPGRTRTHHPSGVRLRAQDPSPVLGPSASPEAVT